jgi:hypothetical protein
MTIVFTLIGAAHDTDLYFCNHVANVSQECICIYVYIVVIVAIVIVICFML